MQTVQKPFHVQTRTIRFAVVIKTCMELREKSNLRFIIDGQIFVNCMVGFNNKFNDRTKLWCMINVFSANATFEVCEVIKMRYGYRNLITVNIIGNRV